MFGSTYFWNKAKDRIDYEQLPGGSTYSYFNIDNYKTWGVESFLQIAITNNLRVSGQHTWMKVSSDKIGLKSMKPENSVTVNVDWNFLDKGTLTAGVNHTGKRRQTATVDVPGYQA